MIELICDDSLYNFLSVHIKYKQSWISGQPGRREI
jgi:hypothetical protein